MSNDLGGLGIVNDEASLAESLIIPTEPQDQASPDREETASAESPDNVDGPEEVEPEARQAAEEGQEVESDEDPEDQPEEEPQAAADGDDLFEIVVEGETQEVTLDELRNGYLRQSDYTRKRQADAQARQEFEQQREQFQGEVGQRLQQLDALAQQAQVVLSTNQRSQEEWEQLRQEDPAEYLLAREQEQNQRQWLMQVDAQRNQALQQQRAAEIPKQREKLVETLASDGFKDWATPEGFEREYARLGQFVSREFGITPEEWNGTVDHRSIRIAYHAMRNLEATRQSAPLKEKIRRKAKPALRPGAPRQPEDRSQKQRKAALDRLRKSSGKDMNAAADVLLT